MSDNINGIIAQPIGINPLTSMQQWQAYRQAQAATQGQQIGNQANQLDLLKAQSMAAPYLPGGRFYSQLQGGPPPAQSAPASQSMLPPAQVDSGLGAQGGQGGASAPVTPVAQGALPTIDSPAATPPAAGALASSNYAPAPDGWSKPLPPGQNATAATHSSGMPEPGQVFGQPVSPYNAIQTLYGVPLPIGYARDAAFNPSKSADIVAKGMEERRYRLQELMGQPDWNQGIQQAYTEGWIDPQHYQMAINNPQIRDASLAVLQSPDSYQANLEKYSGQGLRPDPATGQLVVSPVSIQAAGAKAGATATAEDQARLQYAQRTAAATGLGDAASKTATVYVPGPTDRQGNPTFIPKTMSQLDALAYVRGQGGGATSNLGGAGSAGAGSNNIGPLAGPIPNQDGTPPPGFNGGLASTAPAGQPSASTGYLPPRAAPATQALGPNSYLPPNAGAAPGAPPVNQLAALTPPAPSPAQSNVLSQIAPNLPPAPMQRGPAPQGLTAPPGSLANQSAVTGGAGVAAPSSGGIAPSPGSSPGPSPADTAPGVQSGPAELSPAGKADLAVTTAARTAEQSGIAGAYGEQAAAVIRAGVNAPDTLGRLNVLENAAQQFRPGASATARLGFFKTASDALQSLGITPPPGWVQSAAAGETIGKESGWLGAQMTKALGSREAASVFQAVSNINPNISMSSGGFPIIVESIRQGALRDTDLMNYQEQWLTPTDKGGLGNSTTMGMAASFNRQFPPESYASRIVPFPQPSSPSKLTPNTYYKNSAGNVAMWNGSAFVPAGAQ